MKDPEIEKLQELMVGGTVLKIASCRESESLCTIHVKKDGKKYNFTLFATDLGWWVGKKQEYRGN